MMNVIFPLMCVPPEDEEEEEDMMESDELSANTPQTMSAQVIDNLALHLPPESLIPNLVSPTPNIPLPFSCVEYKLSLCRKKLLADFGFSLLFGCFD